MRYGSVEFEYSEPFARALASDDNFRAWVLRKTKFADVAQQVRVLDAEMLKKRSKRSSTWWRSHYSEKCRCEGCRGQETDILAICETTAGNRFAMHVEVKQPTDVFKLAQMIAYPVRAKCWAASAPKAVLRHDDACTLLLCDQASLKSSTEHLPHFDAVITFQEIAESFPQATYIP